MNATLTAPAPETLLANKTTKLRFADGHLSAVWIENACGLAIPKGQPSIVVNTSTEPAVVAGPRGGAGPKESWIHPWRSTILEDTTVVSGESLVVLRVISARDLGEVVSRAWFSAQDKSIPAGDRWQHTQEIFPTFPQSTPLWRSPQDCINTVTLDPAAFASQGVLAGEPRRFQVKVNVWYAMEKTDCRIHNQHTFLEVHTQVHGIGRMQKFHTGEETTQYEDVILGPGATHDPFMEIAADGSFIYPWHRYLSDTDCIWMAIELHPEA